MSRAPLIPELKRTNRFIRQAVAAGVVHAVSDGTRLADVASPTHGTARTTLLWTVSREAERWGDVLIANARISTIGLSQLATEILPALHLSGRLVGLDWCAEPVEPEVGPMDLIGRLQAKALDCFLVALKSTGKLWIVEDASGPVVAGSLTHPGQIIMPCFTTRLDAEHHLAGLVAGAELSEIGLSRFVAETVPWLAERGWLISPGTWGGPGGPEVPAGEFPRRLATASAAA